MNEEQLEDALRTLPLEEVPTGFSSGVIEKIAPRQSYVRVSHKDVMKFRLTWMDFALGVFFSLLPVLGLVAFLSLPQKLILDLKYQWLLLQFPTFEPLLLVFAGTLLMLFLLTILLGLRSILPRQVTLF
jgi:hypothetical protein